MSNPSSNTLPAASPGRAVLAGALGGALAASLIVAAGLLWFTASGTLPGASPGGESISAGPTAVGGQPVGQRGDGPAAVAPAPEPGDEAAVTVASLAEALDAANAERRQLAEALRQINREVATLRDAQVGNEATIERLQRELADAVQADDPASAALASGDPAASSGGLAAGVPEERAGWRFGSRTDTRETSLVAAGVDPGVARDIQQRSDAYQLARLELIDRAAREGRRGSESFHEEMQALEETAVDLRVELGDAGYDRYLYESGETNRVQIASVIGGSAAALAGIEQGDVIESYAGSRVYTLRELRDATRAGARGELVQLVLRRDGQYLTMDVERGPLGITMSGVREAPES